MVLECKEEEITPPPNIFIPLPTTVGPKAITFEKYRQASEE